MELIKNYWLGSDVVKNVFYGGDFFITKEKIKKKKKNSQLQLINENGSCKKKFEVIITHP